MSVCASGVLTSQVPRLRLIRFNYITSISPPPLPCTGIDIETSPRSQLQLRGCINSSRGLAEPSTSSTISPPYTHASNGSVPPRSCLYNPPLPLGFFSTHQLSTSIPSLSFIKKHHQPSMTTHLTPAQRAEVHAALNELTQTQQIFDRQVEELIDPNVDLELQVAFTLVDLRQMMYLVTTDFATYCNAFPAGLRERQARVRVLRGFQDHLNLFVQLARL
ncbi:hypothetical protein PSHT_08440 [Puccinia striiformis]|uniref:Uncharacterized protein n=1 Tax=Puccinia striiformis TaxID=27350 RepID=A0A2S4VPW7_9BASI|nr:hypothetical protein PSHT_08440 [Puccinia striiformis]